MNTIAAKQWQKLPKDAFWRCDYFECDKISTMIRATGEPFTVCQEHYVNAPEISKSKHTWVESNKKC